jgi:hypothetical protein
MNLEEGAQSACGVDLRDESFVSSVAFVFDPSGLRTILLIKSTFAISVRPVRPTRAQKISQEHGGPVQPAALVPLPIPLR